MVLVLVLVLVWVCVLVLVWVLVLMWVLFGVGVGGVGGVGGYGVVARKNATHNTTPTLLTSAGAQGRHRLAPDLVDGPSSMTQKDKRQGES